MKNHVWIIGGQWLHLTVVRLGSGEKNCNKIWTLLRTYYFQEFQKSGLVGLLVLPGTIHHHLLALTGLLLANVLVVVMLPPVVGLMCAVTQLVLKGVYRGST
jgi:hypothetical protein